ncbi:uncharacterized protein A4U43_C07F11980, partial [Asparagus officinalis]
GCGGAECIGMGTRVGYQALHGHLPWADWIRVRGVADGLVHREALFVSMFNPLLLVIVAVLGWAILDEKLYFGT